MMSKKTVLFYFVFILSISYSFAQYTEVINSNRPGVSHSAFAVGTNVLQLETGPYMTKEEHSLLKYEVEGSGVDFAVRYGLLLRPPGRTGGETCHGSSWQIAQESVLHQFGRGVCRSGIQIGSLPHRSPEDDCL